MLRYSTELAYIFIEHLLFRCSFYIQNDLNTVQYSERDINIHPMYTLVGNYIYTQYAKYKVPINS